MPSSSSTKSKPKEGPLSTKSTNPPNLSEMDLNLDPSTLAEMLIADARSSSSRNFSAKREGVKAKPNMNFLGNLLRETNGFNKALLEKEAEERRERDRARRREERRREKDGKGREGKKRKRERDEEDEDGGARRRERRERDEKGRKERSKKDGEERKRDRHRDRDADGERTERNKTKTTKGKENLKSPPPKNASSPGPTAPPIKRGRGHTSHDTSSSEDEDDWTSTLASRSAQLEWRAKGAERLRLAGFSDAEVARWEGSVSKSGGWGFGSSGQGEAQKEEGNVEDVKWAKKGETREWDVGK